MYTFYYGLWNFKSLVLLTITVGKVTTAVGCWICSEKLLELQVERSTDFVTRCNWRVFFCLILEILFEKILTQSYAWFLFFLEICWSLFQNWSLLRSQFPDAECQNSLKIVCFYRPLLDWHISWSQTNRNCKIVKKTVQNGLVFCVNDQKSEVFAI